MKEFDLEAVKNGSRVMTRDGRTARIVSFDAKGDYPIVALVQKTAEKEDEVARIFTMEGKCSRKNKESPSDLVIAPSIREGFINIFKKGKGLFNRCECVVYPSENSAKLISGNSSDYITTVKIEWEE